MKTSTARLLMIGGVAAIVLAILLDAADIPLHIMLMRALFVAGAGAFLAGLVFFVMHPVRRHT